MPARSVSAEDEDQKAWQMLQLLTTKPILYVCNAEENSAATEIVTQTKLLKWRPRRMQG